MRTRPGSADHQDVADRRLELLSRELAAARELEGRPAVPRETSSDGWWGDHTRVVPANRPVGGAEVPGADHSDTETPRQTPDLPRPGRHASRRPGEGLVGGLGAAAGRAGDVVPAPLRGRVGLGAPQLAVVAVVVALGLAVTTWWVVRSDPRTVEAPSSVTEVDDADLVALAPVSAEPTEAAGGGEADDTLAAGAPTAAALTVDVAGDVRRPGIAVLPVGARVVDALEAAGGARRGVDLTPLNLARPLVDGEQVVVGEQAALAATSPLTAPGASASAPSGAGGPPQAPVNLNLADQATLETLPQVGPVTALAILAWREEHGAFTAVEELLEVNGIGDVTLAQIAPHATV